MRNIRRVGDLLYSQNVNSGSLLCRVCDTIRLVPVRFWRTGHGRVVRTIGIVADGGFALRPWGPRSKLCSSTWSNSLITDNHPAASARRHALMFPQYKNSNLEIYPFIIESFQSKSTDECTSCHHLLTQEWQHAIQLPSWYSGLHILRNCVINMYWCKWTTRGW